MDQVPNLLPIDLADTLYVAIAKQSLAHADVWRHVFIERHAEWNKGHPVFLSEVDQMKDINYYWRMQLGLMTTDTVKARSCIIDNLSVSDWIHNYEVYVIPTIVSSPVPSIYWKA